MRLLNVGSAGMRGVPEIYEGWEQDTLDIDPLVKPDVVCDARKMLKLPAGSYDSVYCSHCLEHFHKHEVPRVLRGFNHVLNPKGFAFIAVPDMSVLFEAVRGRDINDIWYISAGGPISFHDVIYGWSKEVSQGNSYYCHKTGFTETSLTKTLQSFFQTVMTAVDGGGNLYGVGFKSRPTAKRIAALGF